MSDYVLVGRSMKCPACGADLNGALGVTDEIAGVDSGPPMDGDAGLCFECSALLIYSGTKGGAASSMRYPTDEEQRELLADPDIQMCIQAVRVTREMRDGRR